MATFIVLALSSFSCSDGDPGGGSVPWEFVQSGSESSVSWELHRTTLAMAGTPAKATCLSFETKPAVSQKHLWRPDGLPRSHQGKTTFCGVPTLDGAQGELPETKLIVVGSNLESNVGAHDVFGLSDPEVSKVTGTFTDGTTVEGSVRAGTFVVTWSGPKVLDKVLAFAAEKRVGECSPPGRSEFLNLETAEKSLVAFTCRP